MARAVALEAGRWVVRCLAQNMVNVTRLWDGTGTKDSTSTAPALSRPLAPTPNHTPHHTLSPPGFPFHLQSNPGQSSSLLLSVIPFRGLSSPTLRLRPVSAVFRGCKSCKRRGATSLRLSAVRCKLEPEAALVRGKGSLSRLPVVSGRVVTIRYVPLQSNASQGLPSALRVSPPRTDEDGERQ